MAGLSCVLIAEANGQGTATATITGTLASGYDRTGVFGSPETSLTGKTATITYTFSEAQASTEFSCTSTGCTSEISSPSGTVTIAVGGVTANLSPADAISAISRSAGYNSFQVAFSSTSTSISVSSPNNIGFPPSFDWRGPVTVPGPFGSELSSIAFNISNANSIANGTFDPATVTASQSGPQPCSATVQFSIKNTGSSPQANILGGSLKANQSTILSASLTPTPSGAEAVTWTDTLAAPIFPSSSFELATTSTGTGTVQVAWNSTNQEENLTITPSACGKSGSPLPIHLVYPTFPKTATYFDYSMSAVSNSTFANGTAWALTDIENFFVQQNSFLYRFYLDTTTPAKGGWLNPAGTGAEDDVYQTTDQAYCPSAKVCPVVGDSGVLAAEIFVTNAVKYSINPQVLLATMQKEEGFFTTTALPSSSLLNYAMGCGASSKFTTQVNCAASLLAMNFKDSSITYPYFFPVNSTEKSCYPGCSITHSIQYSYGSAVCNQTTHPSTCDLVGFWIADAATYTQYKYTPFVTTQTDGGGFFLFENVWYNYF